MYILKNALKNVVRNKGRNILIAVILLAIIVTVVVALCINNTSSGIIEDYKQQFGSQVTINFDYSKLMGDTAGGENGRQPGGMSLFENMPSSITSQQYIEFADSDYLSDAVLTAQVTVGSDEIEAIDGDLENNISIIRPGREGEEDADIPEETIKSTMTIYGNVWSEFDDGTRYITDGDFPENDGECLISEALAELNGLSVGDKMALKSSAYDMDGGYYEKEYELTISGIYFDSLDEYNGSPIKYALMNRSNSIFTTFGSVTGELNEENTMNVTINATYYLKNPEMLEDFANELYAKGLDENYKVTTDETTYNTIVGPVENMKKTSLTYLLIVVVLGGIIIALLTSIAVRERKYEIGVLRAMGMKKSRVALGIWSELIMITAICLVLGIGIGTITAQPASDMLLESQTEEAPSSTIGGGTQQTGQISFGGNTGGGGMIMGSLTDRFNSSAQAIDTVDISLDLITVLEIIGIALILATLAAAAALSLIVKYEPIKILMNRN